MDTKKSAVFILAGLCSIFSCFCTISPGQGQLRCDEKNCPPGWICNAADQRCYAEEYLDTDIEAHTAVDDSSTPGTDPDSEENTDTIDGDGGPDGSVDTESDTDTQNDGAPSPNPATFSAEPFASDVASITMIATSGLDPDGPVEYLFRETSGNEGGSSSGWQTSRSHIDTGLTPNTQYTYTVQMRDSKGNAGSPSVASSATTRAAPMSGLIQHLDATATSSVVFETDNIVRRWRDLTGLGNHANADRNEVTYPSTTTSRSGLAGLDLGAARNSLSLGDGKDWLSQSSDSAGFAILVAFKVDSFTTDWSDFIGNTTTATENGFGLRWSATGTMQAYLGGTRIARLGGFAIAPGDTMVYAFNYNASTGEYLFWDSKNGTPMTGTIPAENFSNRRDVTLGTTNQATRFTIGMVGEIRVFERSMTAEELADQRTHLVAKWIE